MASLVKTVEMRILADSGDAQKKLDELDAKAKKLDGDSVRMRFRLDDAKGKAQLDAIEARAKALGYKDVEIKVRVDGAGRAVADLMAIKHEEEKVSGGGLLGGLGGLLGGVAGAAGNLPLVGGLAGAGGGAGIPVVAAGLAALLPEIVAVGSGFAAAGAGAGAFYLLAHPAINNLQQDVQALSKANMNLGFAQQKYLIDPTKAHAKALHEAQVTYQAIYKQMGQDAGPAAAGMLKLHDAYVKMSNAFQPQAFKIFADGLKVITSLLPAVTPMANAFANALHPLLQQLNGFTQSAGFKQWLQQFTSLIGPAVTAIGKGIGGVVNEFGKLMVIFSGKDVANGINIAFGIIKGVIQGVIVVVSGLKAAWDSISQNSTFKRLVGDFKTAWDSLSTIGRKKPDFSGLTSAIKDAVNTAVTWLNSKLSPMINSALKTASAWLSANASSVLVPVGKAIMQGLISGLRSQIPSLLHVLGNIATFIAEHKGPIEKDRLLLVPHGQAIMQGLMAGMDSQMPALRSQLAGITGDIRGTAGYGYGGGVMHLTVNVNGQSLHTKYDIAQEIHQVMRDYKRNRGGAPLGLG